ncbi:hypothetical protein [Flexithrix dorotheae]|uniref:hypothetical protein n=1 Tax=Flexithrix dorotheae TaxID=70993 RepID=UPI000376E844|nr:hypothetical protein [Flexithrix dorotheae]
MYNLDHIIKVGIRYIIYGIVILGLTQILFIDAPLTIDPAEIKEATITEWLQLLFLLIMFLIHYYLGRSNSTVAPITNFFNVTIVMILIRELDWFIDKKIMADAWLGFELVVFIIGVALFIKHKDNVVFALGQFISLPGFGIIVSGFFTSFVFAPMLGEQDIWQMVMDGFLKSVADAAEEGVELLGYTLLLIGTIEYFISIKAMKKVPS